MIKLRLEILFFLFFFSFSVFGSQVSLGSLAGRPNSDLQQVSKTLSSVTTPKVLSSNDILKCLDFEMGIEQALYRVSSKIRSIAQNRIDSTYYLPFLMAKMGLPKGFNVEMILFLPGAVNRFSVFSTALKYIPLFLAQDKFFFTPAFRQSYTHTKFDQYNSDTWTTDLILSTKKFFGLPLYGGGGFIKVFGEYDKSVLDATQIRKTDTWTRKFFFGLNHDFKLSKTLNLNMACEASFVSNAQAYSLKTTIDF